MSDIRLQSHSDEEDEGVEETDDVFPNVMQVSRTVCVLSCGLIDLRSIAKL